MVVARAGKQLLDTGGHLAFPIGQHEATIVVANRADGLRYSYRLFIAGRPVGPDGASLDGLAAEGAIVRHRSKAVRVEGHSGRQIRVGLTQIGVLFLVIEFPWPAPAPFATSFSAAGTLPVAIAIARRLRRDRTTIEPHNEETPWPTQSR